jgi:hypothetical protein
MLGSRRTANISGALPRGPAAETGKTERAKKSVETERGGASAACNVGLRLNLRN